ncbi:unnamed protein product [Paramecium sonneborni]|uniref:Uncharacterized protein n=1 Tax=Paramecium sonneborni TaxID=65129 RepID=A0A8S1RRM8_9CILI|nr:unnamed protein product [Paramecium sonneborni]
MLVDMMNKDVIYNMIYELFRKQRENYSDLMIEEMKHFNSKD